MDQDIIHKTIELQRIYFATHQTKEIRFRIEMLEKLKKSIIKYEQEVIDALYGDFNKPPFEAYSTEIMLALREIDWQIKNINKWGRPKKRRNGLLNFPSSGYVYYQPYGIVLIIAPWNYPFQLLMIPLIGAIAAGNCVILKPAEISVNTSLAIKQLIESAFSPDYISVFLGGKETIDSLLKEKFDFIFFTGSQTLGKKIMTEAAKTLTPVCLELGDKCPCIVDRTANLKIAAKRIAWGKFLNAGQSCNSSDYVLVDRLVAKGFLLELQHSIVEMYSENPQDSKDFARIIDHHSFKRLVGYLTDGQIYIGGQTDEFSRYIAPTVLVNVNVDSPVMNNEIFGPILPVIEYSNISDALSFINGKPKPLAIYIFSKDKKFLKEIIHKSGSGAVCINEVVMQITSKELPFGGVGLSGIGRYHGKASYNLFSNLRSVLIKPNWPDIPLRYPPYRNKLKFIKKLLPFLD
jgi:aldehyde dehydrogenase (NAD+)